MLEKKEMSKKNWKRVMDSTYLYQYLEEYHAMVSVLHLKKLVSPCYKEYGNKKIKIADDGYYWLQFAIDGEHWWLTAMYDKNKNLIQYYFDITDKNTIKRDGTSYFYDLYLDIVSFNQDNSILLDEEELINAYNHNEIKKEQFDKAYITSNEILKGIKSKRTTLDEFCLKELKKLTNIN